MKPFKDHVHQDHMHARRVDTTDEDILSGMIAMIVLGVILGAIIGFAI
jgi:hypothetical protein